MAVWGRITSLIAGIGISRASSVVIEPALEPERQKAWQTSLAAILAPPELARLVAQGLMDITAAEPYAARNGYSATQFQAQVQLELAGPGVATALDLYRRNQGPDATAANPFLPLLQHALAKAQVEPQYWPGIIGLADVRIPADLLAFAHQRGIVDNPADPVTGQLLIPVSPPTTNVTDVNGNPSPIQQLPVNLDVLAEFAATGWDFTRAAVNARARGLPPAPGELLQLVNRGTISKEEYYVGIGEGDTRNEWRDYLLTLARRLLTPHDYAELYLRGWIDQPTRDAGAALSGMNAADTQLLYQVIGRPVSALAITKGLERGATYNPLPGEITDPYQAAAHQSNVRPEWYALWIAANQYQYPPLFQTINMLKAGTVTPAVAAQWLLFDGYAPSAVSTIVDSYATPTTTASSAVKSAQTKLRTAAEKAYVAGASTTAEATTDLEAAGVVASDVPVILAAWDQIKAIEARTTPPVVAPPGGG
jgi:hypothetical protein